ncbi:MAG: DNA-binding protein [Gemmatimonas sp.]
MPARKAARKTIKPGANTDDVIAGPPKANPKGMSNPATRALATIGVTRISQLVAHSEREIADLHGMGPSGIKALKAALRGMGLSFKTA